LAVAVAAAAWGTGGAVASVLYRTTGLGPVAVSFWRFVGGVLLLAVARTVLRPTGAGASRLRLVVTGVGLAVYQTAYFAAVQEAGLALATMVTLGAGPVLIALGARAAMAERLGRAGACAVAVSLVGLALLVGGDASAGGIGRARLLGVGYALLSATGYATVTVLSRRLDRHGVGQPGGGDPYGLALGGFAVGAVCLLPLAAITGLVPAAGSGWPSLALLVYLAAVPTALAYGLFFASLGVVRATTVSVVALLEPVTAAVIAVLLLDEKMTATAVAGAAILLAAVAALAVGERRAAPV
jgi:DME family drug/metabolite transporter